MAQSDARGIAIAAGVQTETASPTIKATRKASRRAMRMIIMS